MARFPCPDCAQEREFSGKPGDLATCSACGSEVRIPLPKTEGREVTCGACGESQQTGAAPGRKVRCKSCQGEVRVPMRSEARETREVVCPACGAIRETPALPGKKTRCLECKEQFRVPLGDPSETVSDPDVALRTLSACVSCGERYPLSRSACPECGLERGRVREAATRARDAALIGGALLLAFTLIYLTLAFGVFKGEVPPWLRLSRQNIGLAVCVVGTAIGIGDWLRGRARR